MHRLYYTETKDGFYFASEAKAILKVLPELKSPDDRGLGELVACGCVLENRTIFRGICVLPGASQWTFQCGRLEAKKSYFDPSEWEGQTEQDPERHAQQLRSILGDRLGLYFGGDQVAMSLTGGLDTRLIMAWRHPNPQSLPCFTFGGMLRECRDIKVARQVAAACGQEHQVLVLGQDFLAQFPRYAERTVYLTDGCTSVRHAPDLYLNEQVATMARVRMTGNYGDEVFRRFRILKPKQPRGGIFSLDFQNQIDAAVETYSRYLSHHPLTFAAFRQAPWAQYGLLSLEQSQVSIRSPFLDNEMVRQMYCAPQSACADNALRIRLISDASPQLASIPTDLGFGDESFAGAALRRIHALTMKAEYAYDYGMPKWLAKIDCAVSRLHPEYLFLGRHKFCHFRLWYKTVLAGYVRDVLFDPRSLTRPYLSRGSVQSMVADHQTGKNNYTTQIHQLLHLELLHRSFID
jgi:asparagine synthase (glutamine-hydrolysing)